MNITILNGNPDTGNSPFDSYLNELSEILTEKNNTVTNLTLRDMDIKYCTGCFSCWLKTPGECITKDDSPEVRNRFVNSDFVLFSSPVIMGFPSTLLKKMQDKFIPLIHPYFEFVQNEMHHKRRYDKYPVLGLLIEKSEDTDDEDISIIHDIYRRTALNFRSSLKFLKLTGEPAEEVANEIISV